MSLRGSAGYSRALFRAWLGRLLPQKLQLLVARWARTLVRPPWTAACSLFEHRLTLLLAGRAPRCSDPGWLAGWLKAPCVDLLKVLVVVLNLVRHKRPWSGKLYNERAYLSLCPRLSISITLSSLCASVFTETLRICCT